MYNILLVEKTKHSEKLDGKITDVWQCSSFPNVSLVIVGVQWCGAQVLKHQAVVWPIQELILKKRYKRLVRSTEDTLLQNFVNKRECVYVHIRTHSRTHNTCGKSASKQHYDKAAKTTTLLVNGLLDQLIISETGVLNTPDVTC